MTLVTERDPPRNRAGRHDGPRERHLSEAAVMLAMATWLFDQGATKVTIHPDGMHLKVFDALSWLNGRKFVQVSVSGRTGVGGTWQGGAASLTIHPMPGRGDVVGKLGKQDVEIEAKGGCINTRHAGQKSRLRKGLHEAVGQLMASRRRDVRLIAAVPDHGITRALAQDLLPRCGKLGIEIALVDELGRVDLLKASE